MKRLVAVVSVGFVIWLCGCPPPPGDTIPPTITDVQVNPTNLRFTGGEVTISAQVNDPSGVTEVWGVVQKPDGTKERVMMNLSGSVYQGTMMAGANTRNDCLLCTSDAADE